MLRVAGRFILDWNPTRQDVAQTSPDTLSEFIVPYVAHAPSSHVAAITSAASSTHHTTTTPSVAAVASSHVTSHTDTSAIDALTFGHATFAAAPAAHADNQSHFLSAPPAHPHDLIMNHVANTMVFMPSPLSAPVLHPYIGINSAGAMVPLLFGDA